MPESNFEQAMKRYRPILRTLAEAMIGPNWRPYVEASDVVQQTLLEAHRRADELAMIGDGPLFVWLRKALEHNVLDAIKQLKTQKHDMRRTMRLSELEDSFEGLEQFFLAADTSPSQRALNNEQVNLMLAAIQELPDNQRIAVIMKHLRGQSLKEIAVALELSEPAVAGLLHRGRRQLVKFMEEPDRG